jgi:hypothetical protein
VCVATGRKMIVARELPNEMCLTEISWSNSGRMCGSEDK